MMNKQLSIIIPFFNAKNEDIKRCLDSIYSQGLDQKEYEVIVVNDCSTDKSAVDYLNSYRFLSSAAPPQFVDYQS